MAKNPVQYYEEVKQETRKVTWPTRKEVTVTTIIVFVMVVIIALFLMLADSIISEVVQFVLAL